MSILLLQSSAYLVGRSSFSARKQKKNANKAAEYNVTTDVLTVLFFARLRIYFRQCLNCQGHCAD